MVLLPILVCLYLQSAYGKPVPTPANVTCSGSDEVAKLVNEKIVCWKLSSSCPMGYGLTVELGKVYPAEERISCDPCLEGSTFSDKDDFSQCKNCTRCWENEIPFGLCTISKDSIMCECKSGFYRTNDDFSRCTKCKTCGENELAIGLCTREKDNITCECKPGFYKPNDDLNQCTKCKTCGENELTIGLCTRENDNTTCECKPGYYRSPDAGHRCRHCTRCCGQANDDCSSPEAKKCSVEIICPTIPTPSYSTPGSTVSMSSNSKAPIKSKSNKSQEQHDPMGGIVLEVLGFIIVLISIIILGYVKYHNPELHLWKKERASTSNQCYMVIGNLPQQAYFNRTNSSVEFSSGSLENELTSVTAAAAQAGNQNVLQVTGLPSNNPAPQPQLPRVTAAAAQAGNQNALQLKGRLHKNKCSSLNDEEDQAIPSTGSYESIVPTLINFAVQGHSYVTTENQCIRSPCTQVTELPEAMLQNVCNILDEEDAFFQDYRMFTEELGMKKSVKLSLKNTTLRTYTVLKKYKVTIKTFLEIIQTIIQSNAGTGRADNLVQITDDVKSWLDYSACSNFLTSAC